ncbi:L-asparaginase 2 [Fusarium oxysporum f. sp. cubense]|uniref:asparaginase n=2 Tax=Fusarium oxysporum f. sp. cubense TaxID=61366 RepID=N4TT92_FUSC1|nr:L-asparaginase 2 [Fusarium oxysporum f. sp. cubense race 1]TVY73992.1 L-asparaginase 2 [Fusarium oxysporum f. sp. cubense]
MIATGGTITAKGVSSTDTTNYQAGAFGIEHVIKDIRSFWNGKAEVITHTPFTLDSINLDLGYKISLYDAIMAQMDDEEVVGILVIMGTDEMATTANFVDFIIPNGARKRIAFAGATRPHTALSPDGPGNVVAAVNTLLDPSWTGVVMVMNDKIMRPQGTKKMRNRFEPGPGAFLGEITNFEPRLGQTKSLNFPKHIDISSLSQEGLEAGFPGAAIVPVTVDCNASQLIAAIVSSGAKVIVIEAYSNGWLPDDWRETIAEFANRHDLVVVLTSRHGSATVETTGVEGLIPGGDWMPDQLLPILQLMVKLGYTKEGIWNKIH